MKPSSDEGFLVALFALVFLAAGWLLITMPFYILGRRRGLDHPWVAFLPLLGIAIVLFESIGKSGWLGLLVFVPTVGPLLVFVWTAVEVPTHHGRSRWWTAALIVPIVNLIGYWFYALTLARREPDLAFA